MEGFGAARATLVSRLQRVRCVSFLLGFLNLDVVFFAGYLLTSILFPCSGAQKLPFAVSSLLACVRIVAMVGIGIAQLETAETVVNYTIDLVAVDAVNGRERRLRYKRWLCWTRFGMAVTVLQFIGAIYLTFTFVGGFSRSGGQGSCYIGKDTSIGSWKKVLVASYLVLVWLVAILQCFTGSDILRWRSFYATHDTAWKAHYREVFDHAIREALCCLGRVKYLTVLEEDEVYSVARLLGDLVAYRASGTGHLELLAGLALLQSQKKPLNFSYEHMEAPVRLIQEASFLHQFAEAAYTGPLLDFGRNPILFPCAWLYRQGVFTPWARNRRPSLEGDNWWRGHAAAFLKYVNLPPNTLRRGRVSQINREAAYFVVVLHDQRSVVIAVRGTETPEDLITDGLCRECALTADDLDGLINSEQLSSAVRQRILSSFPHYGHAGIIESARELFTQLDGHPGDKGDLSTETYGFLSSLVGVGCECEGYEIRLVGHSLGGAIATVLGLRLYSRYPNLNVYAYGTPPCVDAVIAEACSSFVTTIVYNDEFSARLSVNSILRLRAAAISALSDDSLSDSAIIQKLARHFLHVNKYRAVSASSFRSCNLTTTDHNIPYKRRLFRNNNLVSGHKGKELFVEEHLLNDAAENEVIVSLFNENLNENIQRVDIGENAITEEPCHEEPVLISNQISPSIEDQSSLIEVSMDPPEMFLPGLIIHIVQEEEINFPFWKFWMVSKRNRFRAYVAKREDFRDIAVTPYMFTDHLPWRCHYAMQRVLEAQMPKAQSNASTE